MPRFDISVFGLDRPLVLAVLLAVPIMLPASDAHAIKRINAATTSCKALQRAIEKDGAAIVGIRSPDTGNALYDRFVSRAEFCTGSNMTVRPYMVPTADNKQCPLKYCRGRRRHGR